MAVLPFGSAPSPFKRRTSAIIVPALTSYNEIRGNSGGLTITGGTAASDNLNLASTSNATKGLITTETNSTLQLFTSDVTATAAMSRFFQTANTYTQNWANASLQPMVYAGHTGVFQQSASGFGAGAVFQSLAIIKNANAVAANLGPFYILANNSTIEADGATITQGSNHGTYDSPSITTINSGIFTLGTWYSFAAAGAVGSGATVNNRIGYNYAQPSITGTIRQQYGINVGSVSGATDRNYALYTGTGTSRFGDDVLVDTSSKGLVLRDSNNTRWRVGVNTSGTLTTTQVAFDPLQDMTWYSLFIADSIAQTNGSSVAAWKDQSGNFRDIAQTNSSIQPTYKTSDTNLNSQPSVAFASASSQTIFNLTGMSSAATFTIICVMTYASLAATQRVIGTSNAANTRGFGATSTPNWTVQLSSTATSSGTPATATKYFVRVTGAASSSAILVNEVATASNATTPSGFNRLYLGSGLGTGNYFDGTIAFVGLYTGDITADAQWANLKTYMNTKYGFAL